MNIQFYSFLVISFLFQGKLIFADAFHFYFGIQAPVDPFVGRHDFLQNLHEALTRKVVEKNVQYSSITFVTGRGGIGKTETAQKYIETYADAFDNVIWIEAENELTVEKSFHTLATSKIIADKVQIESESIDKESKPTNQLQKTDDNIPNPNSHSQMSDETIQKIYQILGQERRRTLMIFDNVDKIPWRFFPSDLTKNTNDIISSSSSNSDVVPPSILILRKKGQSSSGKGQQQMDSVKWLPLGPFTDDDNINYILHYPNLLFDLTSDDMPEVKVIENARLLGQLLGGIPLALKQSMTFISIGFKKHPAKGLEKYLSLYKEVKNRDGAFSSSPNSLSSTLESESASLNPIFLTWKITREKLSQGFRGNFTTLIMDSLPFFPPSKMSIRVLFYILSGGKEPFRDQGYHNERAILIKHAISTLNRYAIIHIDRDPSDLKVDLDLDLVGGTLSMHRELQTAVLKAFKEEGSQLKKIEEIVTSTKFINMAAWLLIKSQKFLDKIIEENEDLSLNELYSISAILDRLESRAHISAIDGPKIDIPTLRVISISRFKIALRFQKLENFEGQENCRKLLENSLTTLKQCEAETESESESDLILTNSEFQRSLMQLVRKTFVSKIEYDDEGNEKRVDRDRDLDRNRDLALKALKLQDTLLEITTQVLGVGHPFYLFCLHEKANILWRIDSPPSFRQEALALYHVTYEASKNSFGEESEETIMALHKLAESYFHLDNLPKSLELYSQIFGLQQHVFGPADPYSILTMKNMAAVLGKMGRHEEALKLSKTLMELQQTKSEFLTAIHKELNGQPGGGDAPELVFHGAEKDMEVSNLHNMANYYTGLKKHDEAYKIWEKLYDENLKKRGPDDLRTVQYESEMARILYIAKDYERAMKMQLHVFEIREKLLGDSDPATLDTKFDLARLYHETHNWKKALELFTVVYDYRQKTLGDEDTLATLEKLADVHFELKNEKTVHQMKSQIYTIKKKLFGEEALETVNALLEFATATANLAHNDPKTLKEAIGMCKKVYNAKKKMLGLTHGETLAALFILTNYQAHLGDHDKAMKLLDSVYEFIVNNPDHGPESVFAGATLHMMSQVRQLQGKIGLAIKLDQKSLEINKKQFDPEHANTIRLLTQIAAMYSFQQNYEEALKYYEEASLILVKVYGPEHPKTLGVYESKAIAHMRQKEYGPAADIFVEIYEVRAKTLGVRHPDTIEVVFNMGKVGHEIGNHKEALPLFKEVVEAKTASLGPSHKITLEAVEILAFTYTVLGNFEEGLKNFQRVYEGRRATMGEEHDGTISGLANLAACYNEMGKVDEAVELYRQVYDLRVKTLGHEHSQTEKALEMLNSAQSKLRQKTEL